MGIPIFYSTPISKMQKKPALGGLLLEGVERHGTFPSHCNLVHREYIAHQKT